MTKREVFEAVIAGVQAGTVAIEGMETDEMVAFFENELTNLDKRAERSRATAAKKREAGDALMETVKSILTEEFQTIAEVAAVVAETNADATLSKVQYRLGKLVEAGVATKEQVTVPAVEGGKARKVMAYKLA